MVVSLINYKIALCILPSVKFLCYYILLCDWIKKTYSGLMVVVGGLFWTTAAHI